MLYQVSNVGRQIRTSYSEWISKFNVTQSLSSTSRVFASHYNGLPTPLRSLINIPVTTALTIQQNVFPTILFTEGYHVFRQNFGFLPERLIPSLLLAGAVYLQSPENMILLLSLGGALTGISSRSRETMYNNLLLYGMVLCTISKFYVNPWFTEEHEAIDADWYQITNKTIPDAEYDASFYGHLWDFTKALSTLVLTEVLNTTLSSLLNGIITFKRQYEFVQEWLSNYSAYGINADNKSSGTEADNEKANLNPVQLFSDIEHQNALLSLWNSRINTLIDCGIVCYALFTGSPEIALSLYFFTITLPRFLVISVWYSFIFNTLLSFFEKPAQILHQKLNQLTDLIIRQITNIDHNADLIAFLEGEDFEAKKLLALLSEKRRQSVKHDLLDCGKDFIINFIKNFEWLFPILASLKDVRSGVMKQEEVGPYMMHFSRINKCLTWFKENFERIDEIRESTRRLSLYKDRFKVWDAKRVEIDKKLINSDIISFSGSIFADENYEILLAKGSFTLEPGSITHIKAPSGSGKTTLFKIFRGVWEFKGLQGDLDGTCTLPKQKTAFLPSQVYVLGPDEPLFQTICYPTDHRQLTSRIELVKVWLKALGLRDHIYNNLASLPLDGDQNANKDTIFKWMTTLSDGERKRIAFCNVLLKLETQDIQFLIMDEPFKGVDFETQETMVSLLKERISSNSKLAILFSNHEYNHRLDTHQLNIDESTKSYNLTPTKLVSPRVFHQTE